MAAQGNNSGSSSHSSVSRIITEQEKTEYVNALDDLCVFLEQYSAALTKKSSEITGICVKVDKLQVETGKKYETKI